MAYPNNQEALTSPTEADNLDTVGVLHDVQHADANRLLMALMAKLGHHASANTISQFMSLLGSGTGQSKWGYHVAPLDEKSGAAASYDFQAISQAFRHLLLLGFVRSNTASATTPLVARCNNDASNAYDYQNLTGQNATAGASAQIAQSFMQVGTMSGATAAVGAPGVFAIWIPYYTQTTAHGILALAGHKSDNAAASLGVSVHHAAFRPSSAITRVTLLPGAGSFTSDSLCSLIGFGAP